MHMHAYIAYTDTLHTAVHATHNVCAVFDYLTVSGAMYRYKLAGVQRVIWPIKMQI